MVTPSYTRTAPRRGAVLLFVCRSTPSCRGAQRNKCPWGTTASPSRCARLLALHRRGGRLCPPPYMRIPCDFVGAMPISLRPCHYEPALTLARQSVPPAKKKSLSGFLFLRSQDFFLLTYTIPVSDSAALTAYTPTPASKVLGARIFPLSSVSVVEL